MDECHARGLAIVPAVEDKWYPRLRAGSVKATLVAKAGSGHAFFADLHVRAKQPHVSQQWDMVAVELNFNVGG